MATALDVINRALRGIGVLATGEVASGEMANDALNSLNDVIAGLSNENLVVNKITQDTLTMTGAASYTFGSTGNINTTRPVKIIDGFYRDTGDNDYRLEIITLGEWVQIPDKSSTGSVPEYLYVDYSFPLATLYFYPLVSTGTVYLESIKPLDSMATLATSLSMPNGYDRLLRLALACELMPEYGVQNPLLMQQYIEAKADIKRVNNRPSVLSVSLPFGMEPKIANIMNDGPW